VKFISRNISVSSSADRCDASYFPPATIVAACQIIEIAENRRVGEGVRHRVFFRYSRASIPPTLIAHGLSRFPVIERAPLFLSPSHLSACCTCNHYIHLFLIHFLPKAAPNRSRLSRRRLFPIPLRGKPPLEKNGVEQQIQIDLTRSY